MTTYSSSTAQPARPLSRRLFPSRSLYTKLSVTALLVALIPLISISAVSNGGTQQALLNAANAALAGAARQTAADLDDFIQNNLDTVRTESQLPDLAAYLDLLAAPAADAARISAASEEVTAILHALSRRNQLYILSYMLLDARGLDRLDENPVNLGHDQSRHAYYSVPISTGLPYVSAIQFSASNQPSLYFSAPVRNSRGRIVGVLVLHYNAAILQQIISEKNGLSGADSFAILLDENQLRLADGDSPARTWTTIVPLEPARLAELQAAGRLPRHPIDLLATHLPEFNQNLLAWPAQSIFKTEVDEVGPHAEAAAVAALTNEPWLIVFAQSEEVFLAPVIEHARQALIFGLICIVGVMVAVGFLTRHLTGPINRLSAVVQQVAAGDLNAQAQIETQDEIGILARSFNAMTLQLRQTLQGLTERTAELERGNSAIIAANGRLQHLLTASSTVVYSVDATEKFSPTFVSPNVERQLGYSPQQILATPDFFTSLIHPDDLASISHSQSELIEHGTCRIEYRLRHADGTYRWVQDETRLIYDSAGRPLEIIGSAVDITDRKQAEEALRNSEALYQSLVEVIPQCLCRKDRAGRFTFANQRFLADSKCTLADILGKDDFDLHPPDLAEKYRADDRLVIEHGQTFETVETRALLDSAPVFVQVVKSPIRDAAGHMAGIQIMFWDVTERKHMEDAVRQSRQDLQTLLDNFPFLVWLKDATGHFVAVNEPFARACGRTSPAELIGLTDLDVWPVHLAEGYRADDREVMLSGQKKNVEELISDRGVEKWNETYKAPLSGVSGHVIGTTGFARDITDRKQADAALRHSEEKFRTSVETLLDGFALLTAVRDEANHIIDFRYEYINDAGCQLNQRSRADQLGHGLLELLPEQQSAGYFDEYVRLVENGEAMVKDALLYPAAGDGQRAERYFDSRAVKLGDGFAITWREVTARVQAERAVRDSNDRYHALYLTERRQAQELTLLDNVRIALMREIDLPTVIRAIIDTIADNFGYQHISLYLVDAGALTLQHQIGYEQPIVRIPLSQGVTGRVARTGRAVFIPDVRVDPDFLAATDGVVSEICTPIFDKGQVVGVLNVESTARLALDDSDLRLITALGEHISIAISHARLYAQAQQELAERKRAEAALTRQARTLEALYQTSLEINSQPDVDTLLAAIVQRAAALVGASMGGLYLMQPDGDTLRLVVNHNVSSVYLGFSLKRGEGVAGRVAQSGAPLMIEDYTLWPGRAAVFNAPEFRRVLGVPLKVGARVVGVIDVNDSQPGIFSPEEIQLVSLFADQAAIAVDNAQLRQLAQRHALELEQRVADRTRELTAANLRLKELDQLKDQFMSRINHELRTPLSAIVIYLELLENAKPEKREKYLHTLQAAADRLQRLIEDLLVYNELTRRLAEAQLAPLPLNPVVAAGVTDHQAAAQAQGLTLTADLAPDLPLVYGERTLIGEMLDRLLKNALQYTPAGSITISTGLRDHADRSWLTITVCDTGPGLTAEDLPHIFERFYRGAAANDYKTPGTGLGLAIARDIVYALAGDITVESRPGHGAAFTIWLTPAT